MQNDGLVYTKITDCLSACKHLVSSSPWMSHTRNSLCDVQTRMNEPMQLAIVGRISSSKSTLVNAILGKGEIVRTHHEAETFNVSWLKYGSDDAPITVHFKTGQKQVVERKEWPEWASHKGHQTLKTEVKYLEVTSSNEILKYINIIDTPGLDATSGVDSRNTIDFLKTVNPDAVILMFTNSLSADTLKLIDDFQNSESSISFSLNPMNALGVLSKMDENWDILKDNNPLISSEKAIARTLSSRSDVNKVLFRILPVSALMGLASVTITEEDINAFEQISKVDSKSLNRLFAGPDFFTNEYDFLDMPCNFRKELVEKYGLYGIYFCVRELQSNPDITMPELSRLLRQKSGFDAFIKLVTSHFGDRAQLLKAQRGVINLLDSVNKDRIDADSQERMNIVDSVYAKILSIETDLHELKEWSFLLKIYEGKVSVDEDFKKEFLLISGENGYSVMSKLNVSEDTDISEMLRIAEDRYKYWKAKYNAWYGLSQIKAEPYAIIAKSYGLLVSRLKHQIEEYANAQRTIRVFNHYIYGKD